jgi:tetratricopeptide (TPR) repeat protein
VPADSLIRLSRATAAFTDIRKWSTMKCEGLVFRNCISWLPWLATVPLLLAQPETLLRQAAKLDAEGKCDEAEPLYARALAARPPTAALLNNAGNHYLVCNQPEKARSFFERLLKINPKHINANLQLARLAVDKSQGAKALEYLARVPDSSPAVLLLRAEALHFAGKKSEASTVLGSLEKQANGDAEALFTIGMAWARMGLYDRAERVLNAVAAKRPNDHEVLYNLGRAAARAQHYERAQSALEVAVKLQPSDADSLLELGLVYAARQDYSRSVYVLAQARQRAPKRADILLALARASEDAGYYGDSAASYDEYLKLRPEDDKARRDRARVNGHGGARRDEGLKELAWYIQKHPDDPVGHFDLAQITWRTEPEKALGHLSTALRLDPQFAPAQLAYGWLLHRLGRTPDAIPHLEAAVRLAPNDVLALDQLGLAYLSLDKASDAEKVLRRAMAIAPENAGVLLHLGRSLMALGRDEEAQQFLETFQKVRPKFGRDPRTEPGMIQSATLSAAERTSREIDRFRELAATHPDEAEYQLHLAGLLLANGRVEEAVREYRKLLAGNAEARIWEEAGRALVRAEQYELGREFLERAVDQRPSARLDLAVALFSTKGPGEALRVLEQAPKSEQNGDYLLMKARILDASGQPEQAERVLLEGLRFTSTRPEIARDAAVLLIRLGRKAEALQLLSQGGTDNADLLLMKAIVLGLMDRSSDAEKILRQIEARWPEWDRPYLVHAVLIETARPAEARQKAQTSAALGSQDVAVKCVLARLNRAAAPDAKCDCVKGLYELLFPTCGKM